MLRTLHIQNYAIIEEITVDLSRGLNIITGETGAGKSILMGALSLILGQRADSGTLLHKDRKCVVEGTYHTTHAAVKQFMKDAELDVEEDLVLRREIAVNGKSRAFINDTPVNLQQLRTLGSLLVDLHQQFDTLELGDDDFQREVVDALADNHNLLGNYRQQFAALTAASKELASLQEQQLQANAAADYHQFLFDELDEAGFSANEVEELEVEEQLLSIAETIKQQLGAIYFELKDAEQPVVQQLRSMYHRLQSLENYHPRLNELNLRLQSAQLELQDIAGELEGIDEDVQYNPERLQVVNEKMALGYKLFKKHGVQTTAELLHVKDDLQQKLSGVVELGDKIAATQGEVERLQQASRSLGEELSQRRRKAARPFTDTINKMLAQVGMPNARIQVQLTDSPLTYNGSDQVAFLLDANKSGRFEPLGRVASGGELSRIMLCIKSLVAKKLQLPTLIFDEIDTGISGEAARQVGIIMQELAGSHQLIAITHQPQIAAKAETHLFVFKSIQGNSVKTAIRQLSDDERITAIAQMLSGERPTAAALQNAREMVSN